MTRTGIIAALLVALPAVIMAVAFAFEPKPVALLAIMTAGGLGTLADPFALAIAIGAGWQRWRHAKWFVVTLCAALLYGLIAAAMLVAGRAGFTYKGWQVTLIPQVLAILWLSAVVHFARSATAAPPATAEHAGSV